jgi:simple sugar transport system permease protein
VKAGAIALAALVAIAAIAMALAGANPIDGFAALFRGGLFDYRHPFDDHRIAETLVQTTALLFPALAVAFAFRAGLFNIGAEGQLIIGGLAAGIVGARLQAPGPIAIVCALTAGAIGGAAWAAIAGVLRARFGGSEVIATLMLNIIAALLANYLIVGPLHSPGVAGAETAVLPQTAWLPTLLPGTRLTIALPIALGIAVLVRVFFARSVLGYELRAAGDAPEAARRAGIDLGRMAIVAMTVSGAIAGIGGATIVDGVLHRFNVALSPGYGFIAIAVALVGRLDPIRIIAAAFVFGILQSGSVTMQAAANVPRDVVTFVEGLAILALAAQQYVARRGRTAAA